MNGWRLQKVVAQVPEKQKPLKSKGTFTDGFELHWNWENQVAKCVQTPTIRVFFPFLLFFFLSPRNTNEWQRCEHTKNFGSSHSIRRNVRTDQN